MLITPTAPTPEKPLKTKLNDVQQETIGKKISRGREVDIARHHTAAASDNSTAANIVKSTALLLYCSTCVQIVSVVQQHIFRAGMWTAVIQLQQ